jgi:hypothetical protein
VHKAVLSGCLIGIDLEILDPVAGVAVDLVKDLLGHGRYNEIVTREGSRCHPQKKTSHRLSRTPIKIGGSLWLLAENRFGKSPSHHDAFVGIAHFHGHRSVRRTWSLGTWMDNDHGRDDRDDDRGRGRGHDR